MLMPVVAAGGMHLGAQITFGGGAGGTPEGRHGRRSIQFFSWVIRVPSSATSAATHENTQLVI